MKILLTFLLFFVPTTFALPQEWVLDVQKNPNRVEFLATATAGLKIRGETKGNTSPIKGKLSISPSKTTGEVKLALDILDTGISLRNDHMKGYLETQKFPEAQVHLTKLALPEAFFAGDWSGESAFEGTLTLHGVTKPISGTAKVQKKKGQVEMDYDFKVGLTEYGIKVPNYLGVTVKNDVTITVKVQGPFESKPQT